ncbi:acyl-CoA dehydrogenase family protein (plasmid) [Herbiconiux sp. KACC 21604]|uniref:acyl-CoA dehydrogenase family protein n=1 Tax=unclassified Herbiconiux TaxID=2618217 RepID=UPI0014929C88|nr:MULTISPECIES: acyl-CoA dehydrogenase family protein [unclassified Herbiconiux]QJU56301.1 acyl-CoA dehydrogenase [Herbiconiux sp. SALV-R1]WPO88807.1 acyl-CoA dehydrogenase family protein [Herbiconiux sp. KACC 21604]
MTIVSPETSHALSADLFAFQGQLTAEEQLVLVELREFLDEHVRPFADDWWERAESPRHLLRRFGELGILGYGFEETRPFASSSAFRNWIGLELARCDPSTAVLVGVHVGLGMGSIALGGSQEQRAEWLPRLASGELIAAFGLTEPDHGSDTARGLATTAERRGDEWVLNGAKRWIGNGTFADVIVIWARDLADDSVKGFLVRTPASGLTATKIDRKISMRSVENADIELVDVVVPERDRLQRASSFRDVARVLRHTRLESAWHAAGVSMGAFEAALAYAQSRTQFGRPIASFQLVQQKLADVATNITATLAIDMAASRLSDDGQLDEQHSSLAKAFAAGRLRQSVALCREIAGGNGVQLDAGVARYFGDAEAIYTFEGTHEMNSLILGRALTGIAAFIS